MRSPPCRRHDVIGRNQSVYLSPIDLRSGGFVLRTASVLHVEGRMYSFKKAPERSGALSFASPNSRCSRLRSESHYAVPMTTGWRFIGEIWGTHRRPIVLECVIPIADRKEAEAIARLRLAGAELHYRDRAVAARDGRVSSLRGLRRLCRRDLRSAHDPEKMPPDLIRGHMPIFGTRSRPKKQTGQKWKFTPTWPL